MWKRWIVHNFWRCSTGKSIISSKDQKGKRQKKLERKKEQKEAKHKESAIDGMHVLVILLGCVDSMLYAVFAPDRKQHTAFVACPLRSSYSWHTLHVIESCEPPPIVANPVRSRSKPHCEVDWLKPVRNLFVWNRFKCRRNEFGSDRIKSWSKPDYFTCVEGPYEVIVQRYSWHCFCQCIEYHVHLASAAGCLYDRVHSHVMSLFWWFRHVKRRNWLGVIHIEIFPHRSRA